MDLRPVGGIFWRLDSSGNLTAYDTAGNTLARFQNNTTLVTALNRASASVGSSSQTTSTSDVSAGLTPGTIALTPRVSTAILIIANTGLQSSVAGDSGAVSVYGTTGAVPADGVAATGTRVGEAITRVAAANVSESASFNGLNTGLVNGTLVNYYFARRRVSGTGGVSFTGGSLVGIEV